MNELTINLDDLHDLNIAQFAYLKMKYHKRGGDILTVSGIRKEDITDLIEKDYLNIVLEITQKYIRRFETNELHQILRPVENIEDFIDKYRSIFPTGSNGSGYPYRGDKQSCIKKMRTFIKRYPEFSKDTILRATRDYVNSQFFKGYVYMQTAAYFIEKDGVSNLAGLCESIGNNSTKKPNNNFEEDL